MTIGRVGVVGCGLMGSGIVQVSAAAGIPTRVHEVDERALDAGIARIRSGLDRQVARERMSAQERDELLGRIESGTEIGALADCDLVIEAATENRELKLELFERLDEVCPPKTIFASNTSSLTITEMAMTTSRPARVLGLHFFNPVPVMKLVEIVHTLLTDEAVEREAAEFIEALGKTAVRVKDRTGFIVNRLLVPYLLEAIRALDSGLASAEDLDRAMKLGAGYPMGPLELLDLVGLDTTLHIAEIMFDEFREPQFAPPPLLRRMVLAGRLGRKSGRGFHDYESKGES